MLYHSHNPSMKKYWIFLFLITCLAAVLRLYKLGQIPVGVHRDEVNLGYNAYSLLTTGRDISGQKYPLFLPSFIYGPGGYAYSAIPAIAVFGLDAFAVRLPSAVFSLLSVPLLYLFILKIFPRENAKHFLALAGAFLFAVTPWSVNLARTATENSLATFLILAGLNLYFHHPLPAFAVFGSTLLFYQAPSAFLLLFLPFLIWLYRKPAQIPAFVLLVAVPILFILASPKLSLRPNTVSLLATPETSLAVAEQLREDGTRQIPPLFARAFHNKLFNLSGQVAQNYFRHLTFDFYFTDQALPDRYRVPNHGLLYLAQLPFLLLGIVYLLRRPGKESWLLLGWWATGLVGSSLTFDDVPNLQRTLFVLPAISIITGLGLISFWRWTKQNHLPEPITALFLLVLFAVSLANYSHQYFLHQLIHRPWYRHEGYQRLTAEITRLQPNYQKVFITDRESAPAFFLAFFNSYDPAKFQQETAGNPLGSLDRANFNQYEMVQHDCPLREEITILENGQTKTVFTGQPDILYVNSGLCKPPPAPARLLTEITRSDNSPVFSLYDVP